MANTREIIIETTCDLMENQGYHATGLNEIVKVSGAPKGSLYYYFPEGKESLAAFVRRRCDGYDRITPAEVRRQLRLMARLTLPAEPATCRLCSTSFAAKESD